MSVRSLFKTQKKNQRLVDDEFAKYNSKGQLYCVLCETAIKSDSLWEAHTLTNSHKELTNNSEEHSRKRNRIEEEQSSENPEDTLPADFFDSKEPSAVNVDKEMEEFEKEIDYITKSANSNVEKKEDLVPIESSAKLENPLKERPSVPAMTEEEARFRWEEIEELQRQETLKRISDLKRLKVNRSENPIVEMQAEDDSDSDEEFPLHWKSRKLTNK
jgi:hypothetical protein